MSRPVARVRFATVSAVQHPQYYRGDRPCVAPADVPDEHWRYVERESDPDDIFQQYRGLQLLMGQGELIRDVTMHEAERLDPQWREITPPDGGGTDG